MNSNRSLMVSIVFGTGLLIGGVSSFAQDNSLLQATTAQWWQTMLSIPASVNPILDTTGADCMIGQHDPLWFLAGTFNSTTVRTCTIPAGEGVLFPVINNVVLNTPYVCGQGASETVAELRAQVAPFIDAVTVASATFDSKPLRYIVRVKSKPFAATLPADNIFNPFCGPGGQPAGVFSPSVDDGYYSALPPLTAGTHTLHLHAEAPSFGFTVDVTYILTVVPTSLK